MHNLQLLLGQRMAQTASDLDATCRRKPFNSPCSVQKIEMVCGWLVIGGW